MNSVDSSMDVAAWSPSSRYRILAPDSVEMFAPNHTGLFTLSQPMPAGRSLAGFSFTMQYLAHEDYDGAGLAINNPPHKNNLFGLSFRNQSFENKGMLLKEPFEVRLRMAYQFLLRPAAGHTEAAPVFDLLINGRDVVRIARPLSHIGVFAWEAHVQFDDIRLLLNP